MSPHARTTPDDHPNESPDQERATLRNAAQCFSPAEEPPDAASAAILSDGNEPQAEGSKVLASGAADPAEVDPDGSEDGATLRNAAQGFSHDKPCAAEDDPSERTDDASSDDHESSAYPALANLFERFPSATVTKSADTENQPWNKPLELTEQQKTAINLMLSGERKVNIARKLGVHPGTLWRWTSSDENFRRALAIARERAFGRATEEIREAVPKALEIVKHHMDQRSLQAALHILRIVHIERQSPSYPVEAMFPKYR